MLNKEIWLTEDSKVIFGLSIPLLGTILGAECVFFTKNEVNGLVRRSLAGFAGGVMTAASIWSLLLPSLEESKNLGKWSFIPAVSGFSIMMVLDVALG